MSTNAHVVVLPPGGTTLEIRAVTMPDPGPWEVLVEQRATGVCHSQIGHVAGADPAQPLLLGHESYGVVLATGEKVTHVVPGDEVFITWIPRDGARRPSGVTIPFDDGQVAVTRNVFTWATHSLADEQYVVKSSTSLPADLASIIGCAIMTGAGAVLNCAEAEAGESIAVWGVGGVGLAAVMAARNIGAAPIIAIDIDDAKLQLAKQFGAEHLINASVVDAVEEVRRLTTAQSGVSGVDNSLDCTGLIDNFKKSLASVRPGVPGLNSGGTAVLVGVIRADLPIAGMELLNGQKNVTGCLGGGCTPERDFPTFVEWFRDGRLELDELVTNRYRLDQANEALDDLGAGRVLGRAVIEL